MTVEELIIYGKKYLHKHEVNMLLSNILNLDNLELLNYLDKVVDDADAIKYKNMIDKVLAKTPIQYVLGNVNFYGYNFLVNENVLIPRFETEELVENTLKYIEKLFPGGSDLNIIDLGCGSGNIGITLKKELENANVTCVDISDKAIEVAKHNAEKLNANISFIQSDMLNHVNGKFDVIISNPPYISRDEEIEDIVRNNEPDLALYASDNGLFFYDKILSTCKKNLNDKFLIAFEIGMTQKDRIIDLVNKYFDDVIIECRKDLSYKDRMIFIYSKDL